MLTWIFSADDIRSLSTWTLGVKRFYDYKQQLFESSNCFSYCCNLKWINTSYRIISSSWSSRCKCFEIKPRMKNFHFWMPTRGAHQLFLGATAHLILKGWTKLIYIISRIIFATIWSGFEPILGVFASNYKFTIFWPILPIRLDSAAVEHWTAVQEIAGSIPGGALLQKNLINSWYLKFTCGLS